VAALRPDCLDENTIVALVRGTLEASEISRIDAHIDRCPSCRVLVSRFASKDEPVEPPRLRSGVEASASGSWPTGTLFDGRFEVEEFLKAGGMGRVYRGRDCQTAEPVAIKVLQQVGKEDLSRFEREARLLADLSHPAIVRYVGRGDAPDGTPFLAMEWLEGEDLAQRLARGPLDVDETRKLGAAVAAGLARAHAVGVVHRDIKPSNIFLRDRDVRRATILDFGVACAAPAGSVQATLTRTGTLLGTLAYMAPEQARGAKDVDARADVFSLGCVLFECLTGSRPFPGTHPVEVLAKILADPTPRPRDVAPLVPRDIDELVTHMLAKAPADRLSDCAWIAERLGAPGSCGAPPTGSRWKRSSAWAAGAVALAGLGALGWRHRAALRPAPSPALSGAIATPAPGVPFRPARLRRITSGEQCAEFPSFLPDSRAVAYDAMVGPNSFIFVRDLAGGAPEQLTTVKGWDMAAVVSPDGARIAFLRIADGIKSTMVIDRDGRTRPRALSVGTTARPSWSRDGRSIWTGNDQTLQRYDATSGALVESVPLPAGVAPLSTRELPGGRLVASIPPSRWSRDAGLALIGEDRTLRWLLRGDVEETLAVTPDGLRALTARVRSTGDSELVDVPLDGSPATSLATAGIAPRNGIDLSKDGRHVAWSTCTSRSELVTVGAGGRLEPFLPGWQWHETDIEWIRSDNRAVVLSSRSGAAQPWVVDLDDRAPPRPIAVGDLQPIGVSLSDDGKWLAFSALERGIQVVPVDGSAPARVVTRTHHDFAPSFVRGSHDVLYETVLPTGERQIQRISIDGGEPVVVLEREARSPSASPTDERFVYLAGASAAELTPMIFDPKSRRASPISRALPPASYRGVRFTHDGRRAIVLKNEPEQLELELSTGAIVRSLPIDVTGVSFVRGKTIFVSRRWTGDVWIADDPFPAPSSGLEEPASR